MNCGNVKSLFSPYLDGAVTGKQMGELRRHMVECAECAGEYAMLRKTQALLSRTGRRKAPGDLELKLRLAISREVVQRETSRASVWGMRIEHALQSFMVPATAGLVSTVVLFGLLTAFMAPALRADHPDVPLMLYTAPVLQQSAFGSAASSIQDDSLVIEAYVDANGRVQDYRILSDPEHANDLPTSVKNMLIFTTFKPAMAMGRPTAGRAVMSFSKISVKG